MGSLGSFLLLYTVVYLCFLHPFGATISNCFNMVDNIVYLSVGVTELKV